MVHINVLGSLVSEIFLRSVLAFFVRSKNWYNYPYYRHFLLLAKLVKNEKKKRKKKRGKRKCKRKNVNENVGGKICKRISI
jgi:hypothetical protein